jgi:hypothetical protein
VYVGPFDDQVRREQAVYHLRLNAHKLKDLLRLLQRSREYLYLRLKLSDTLWQTARIGPTRRVE